MPWSSCRSRWLPHFSVTGNGLDTTAASGGSGNALRRELGVAEDEILVGAVGNVRPSKNYTMLLDAARTVLTYGPRVRFVVVGDASNDLAVDLRAPATALELGERMSFVGFRGDLANVFAALDLFVLSSGAEGFSLATVQAMAARVPVIATRCGGPERIVEDGVTGLLVPNGDAAALAREILRLAFDREVRKRLAVAARASMAERYSLDDMLDRYEALYLACLRQARWPIPSSAATQLRAD